MDKNLKNAAERLIKSKRRQQEINAERNRLGEEYEKLANAIKDEIGANAELKLLIETKLCEAIGLDPSGEGVKKFKAEHPQKYSEIRSCSSISSGVDNRITTYKMPEEDPSYFHPMLDKWEIEDIEFAKRDPSNSGEYKFTVECVKQRSYMGGMAWFPKLYSTDWFVI